MRKKNKDLDSWQQNGYDPNAQYGGCDPNAQYAGGGYDPNAQYAGGGCDPNAQYAGGGYDPNAQYAGGGYDPNAQYAPGGADPNGGYDSGSYDTAAPSDGGGKGKKPVVPWVVAVVGLAAAAIMTFFWFRGTKEIKSLQADNTALTGQLEELNRQSETELQNKTSLEGRVDALEAELDAAEQEQGALAEQVATLEQEKAALETENGALAADAQLLETICSFLQSDTAGYASAQYHADEKILVMRPGEETSLNVTADISEVTISVSREGSAADANWATDGFDTVAELTVTALEPGVTTLNFTNDANDQSFRVLVVVVD